MSKEREPTAADAEAPLIKDGWIKKKSSRVNVWGDRFFVLRGSTLYYYIKSKDPAPKGVLPLVPACRISEIKSEIYKKRKQFVFKISWPLEDEIDDANSTTPGHEDSVNSKPRSASLAKKGKPNKKKDEVSDDTKKAAISSSKLAALAIGGVAVGAVTAGVGLLAGLVIIGIGAAAGGGASAMYNGEGKEYVLQLACDTFHEAEAWVFALENQIHELGGTAGHTAKSLLPYLRGLRRGVQTYNAPPTDVRLDEVEEWVKSSKWKVTEVWEGIRFMEQHLRVDEIEPEAANSKPTNPIPCMRVNFNMNASASDTFATIMHMPTRTGLFKSLRIVETVGQNTDIIHVVCQPMYLWPTWTSPRDLCLTRYWKQNSDGSFVICIDSSYHIDCPLIENHVRGELHGVYVIAPLKEEEDDEEQLECSVTFIGQYDPKGWVWKACGYQRAMLRQLILHMLDVRDCLDDERFIQVNFDALEERVLDNAADEDDAAEGDATGAYGNIGTIPSPTLAIEHYKEPQAHSFRVRGATYIEDKVKIVSSPYVFKLVCCDLFDVPGPTANICSHPKNRVYRALQRNEDTWIFAMNIMIPGPPYLSFVAYFQADKAVLTADTPFGRIAQKFFFGSDDEYRNNTFKMIPKVVDGNMVVRMLVKDTPAILGTKLKQTYHKGDNYFELDIDIGSSNVARNAVRVCSGYSKILVVDIGLCLQGNEAEELPEVMMGAVQLIHMDMTAARRL